MTGLRFIAVRVCRLTLAAAICGVVVLAQSAVAGASTGRWDGYGDHDHGTALYVSQSAPATGARDRSCGSAAYSSIQSAVSAAPSGGTVIVCPGTYPEHVVISSPLTLVGRDATIDATSTSVGSCGPLGPCLAGVMITSSWVQISGFTVTGAVGEGILAVTFPGGSPVSHVTISRNRVVGNDTGGIPGGSPDNYFECEAQNQVPGDCGEGIHLMAVADSVVSHNYSSGNTGGMLFTDEFGPTHGNLIEGNIVTGNQYDCGITVPGHNGGALSPTGTPLPNVAGVYDNVIRNNVVTDNGILGEGAGVLFANGAAGSAVYDNLVEGNYIAGNGLSGVTMHAHTLGPNQFEDLSGNRIIGNVIGQNNIDGDQLDGPPHGPQAEDSTTGVLVFAKVPVSVTIARNVIFNNAYGIWEGVSGNVSATVAGNRFFGVGKPVVIQP